VGVSSPLSAVKKTFAAIRDAEEVSVSGCSCDWSVHMHERHSL
jgi:hypothetical protein